jgi:uncharacterized protein
MDYVQCIKSLQFSYKFAIVKIPQIIKMEKITFKAGEEELKGLFYSKGNKKPDIFFLHGGGQSSKERTAYLQKDLLKNNLTSFAFDFSGSGESSGSMGKSSLKKRIREAKSAINLFDQKSINLCGSSMGAYIALSLLPDYDIKKLILFCPAIYDAKAKKVPFGEEFSKIIRAKNSWENSDIFPNLKKFRGDLLIFMGEKDEVIPREAISLLDKNFSNCNSKKIIFIPDCPHKMHQWIPKHKSIKKRLQIKLLGSLNNQKI